MKDHLVALAMTLLLAAAAAAQSQPAPLMLEGRDGKTASLALPELKVMPRHTVKVKNPKTKAKERYEGVLLSDLLAKVAAPSGKTLHGAEYRDYVEVTAADDYRVVFSLAELDPPSHANSVLLADTMDGKALQSPQGPLKLIVPEDIRPERWVRMVSKISIHQAP
jgi:hypothetical protein